MHLPGPEDGAVLLDQLRKSDFAGFAYFWTAADPEKDKLRFASLLGKWGGGGFNRGDSRSFRAVADHIFASWEHFHSFKVENPCALQIADALDAALRVLCEIQQGLWTLESKPDGTKEEWKRCVARAFEIYARAADGFKSLARLNLPEDTTTEQADESMDRIKKLPGTSIAAIQSELVVLRDAMMEVVYSGDSRGEVR